MKDEGGAIVIIVVIIISRELSDGGLLKFINAQ